MQDQKTDKFKYLERSKYRFKKSSSTSNLHETVSKQKSIGESMFALQTNKSSIVDVFNILDQDKKPHSTSTFCTYNPHKYFSTSIEQALRKRFNQTQNIQKFNPQNQLNNVPPKAQKQHLKISISAKVQLIPQQQPSIQIYQQMKEDFRTQNIEKQHIAPYKIIDQTPIHLQCQICHRTFIQPSYKKHILICQKVFFQKRPVFDSRGNSRQKSQNKKSK